MDDPMVPVVLLIAIGYIVYRIVRPAGSGTSRRAAPGTAKPSPEEEARRDEAINKLQDRLQRIRSKKAAVEQAINEDPEGAAKTLRHIINRDRRR